MRPIPFVSLAAAALLAGCAVAPSAPNVMVLPGTQKSAGAIRRRQRGLPAARAGLCGAAGRSREHPGRGCGRVGTALGAAVGALLGSGSYYPNNATAWGAGTGLMMGSAVGSSSSQASAYGLQQRYDTAFVQCMYQLGHQVPGQTAYRRMAPTVPAAPAPRAAPPSYPPPGYPAPNVPPPNTLPPV